jgi:hypothetical protein
MRQAEIPLLVVLILVIVGAPFLPTYLLLTLDWLVIRVATAVFLLYAVSAGPMTAVFGFATLALLYMERNRRKVQGGLTKWDALDVETPQLASVKEAHAPQKTVRVAPFDTPHKEETEYAPAEGDGPMDITVFETESAFEPVAPSLNEKVVMASAYPISHQPATSSASLGSIYEQLGFGHIRQVETVGH